ncbi:MAG: sugar phosphate isomerase/epimerase [Phycisphaerae bacterium]
MKSFRVGVDSYSLGPLRLSPLEMLDWARQHGAAGVHFSGLDLPGGGTPDDGLLRELAAHAEAHDLYLEWGGGQHIPFDMTTWQPRDVLPINTAAVHQADIVGTPIIRSCSGGLMRWSDQSPPTEDLLRETANALNAQRSLLVDANVTLAIELHFEFTTFELLRLFDMCDAEPGGHLGICLDTMNVLTMLEEPLAATERILPWVVATHAKDGTLRQTDTGLQSFTTEIGHGTVPFADILARLATLDRDVHLSVEDHGGWFDLPIFDPGFLSRFPDLTPATMTQLVGIARANEPRLAAGELAPLDRADWPACCAARVARDIATLKDIATRLADSGADA